jgi:hypothetical protein
MAESRIIAVSMATKGAPIMAMASSTSSAFHVHSVEKLPASINQLLIRMIALQAKADELGAELVVEDPTGFFSDCGRQLRLDSKDAMNRPLLVSSMEKYTSLSAVNAITYPESNQSALKISSSLYNIKYSDTGRIGYEIDWALLRDEQRVFLLALHAGLCQTIYQTDFLAQVLAMGEPSLVEAPADEADPQPYMAGGRRFVL